MSSDTVSSPPPAGSPFVLVEKLYLNCEVPVRYCTKNVEKALDFATLFLIFIQESDTEAIWTKLPHYLCFITAVSGQLKQFHF